MGRVSDFDRLRAAGWQLTAVGWQKKGWCFTQAWQALAVEAAFAHPRIGYFPYRTLASPMQVEAARQATMERAGGAR
jgi:hypothetical protein